MAITYSQADNAHTSFIDHTLYIVICVPAKYITLTSHSYNNFLLAIKAPDKDVAFSVDRNNTLTDWFNVYNGVKQGCILPLTLFSMYIIQEINLKLIARHVHSQPYYRG